MKHEINAVKDFHTLTENHWLEMPKLPSEERQKLRYNLIAEELKEFKQALADQDLIEATDALIDILYVTFGSLGEFGLGYIAKDLFDEVHRSNMSKLCKTKEEAVETCNWYESRTDENRCQADYKETPQGYQVFRVSDNKTLKNKYYSPADLKTIIRKGQLQCLNTNKNIIS